MTSICKLSYLFRQPGYPVIVDIEGVLVAARSKRQLYKKLSRLDLIEKQHYEAIDNMGIAWTLLVMEGDAILSPISFKKRRTKLELIRWFNSRKNKPANESEYSEKALSSKRLDRIIGEIADRLLDAEKRNG